MGVSCNNVLEDNQAGIVWWMDDCPYTWTTWDEPADVRVQRRLDNVVATTAIAGTSSASPLGIQPGSRTSTGFVKTPSTVNHIRFTFQLPDVSSTSTPAHIGGNAEIAQFDSTDQAQWNEP